MVPNQSVLFALSAMFLYAAWTILAKFATQRIPLGQAVAITYLAGLITVGGYLVFSDAGLSTSRSGFGFAALSGVFLGAGTLAYYAALKTGQTAIATGISGMYLLVTTILAIILLGESLTLVKGIGLGFAVTAVILLSQ